MVQKLHHAIADGEGSIRMSEQFIDLARDATEPIAPDAPRPRAAHDQLRGDHGGHPHPPAASRPRAWRVERRTAVSAWCATRSASLALAEDAAELGRSAMRQVLVSDPARSPLWRERSLRRRIDTLQVPLDDARLAAKALGGSLNDIFVAAAAGGAGAYHRAMGEPVDELRITMPVSTRTDASAGGNAFTPTRVLLPVGIEDPAERFTAIRERLDTTKRERAMGVIDGLAGLANLLPTSVAVRVARQQVETVDFATSNVRGAPFPLYIAGARILANFPVGPTGGTAWNLTLMSYDGHLDMGLNCDAGAVADPELLRDAIVTEFAALIAAGTQEGTRRPKARR